MGFQNVVRDQQAPAVAGDFASLNPFANVLAAEGKLVAPAGGLIVGNFAFVDANGDVSQSWSSGDQVGFLGRNQQALITEFLGEATNVVPEGFMVVLFDEGDFWALFPAGAAPGDAVYADPNNGTPIAGNVTGAGTGSAGATVTATLNSTNVLDVTAVTHGVINVGDEVSDSTTGANIPAGTTIVQQLTGAAGGVGTYEMSEDATASAVGDTVVAKSNYMLVTAMSAGALEPGDVFSGTDVVAGTEIVSQAAPFSGVASIVTGSLSTLVVTSVTPGTDLLRVGAKLPAIAGLGIAAGTTISAQVSGTPGGVGSYTLSAAGTAGAGVPVTTEDAAGQTGLYEVSPGYQAFGSGSAGVTVTVAGTNVATGFTVRGVQVSGDNILAKISTR